MNVAEHRFCVAVTKFCNGLSFLCIKLFVFFHAGGRQRGFIDVQIHVNMPGNRIWLGGGGVCDSFIRFFFRGDALFALFLVVPIHLPYMILKKKKE